MRSKLLSLHLVLTVLKSHSDLFTNPLVSIPSNTSLEMTPFLQATKQYLCQSLARNAVSSVNQVFELSVEIFWYTLKSMRAQLKVSCFKICCLLLTPLQKEIEVLLNEIFIPILEMRHSTIRQKSLILAVFIRLCQDPQALVEIYINYDCDRAAAQNIYEKLMNIVSKIGQTHFAPPSKEELGQSGSSRQSKESSGPSIPPSLTTAALSEEADKKHYAGLSPEIKLRRQSLECLVAALKSLSLWATATASNRGEDAPRSSSDTARHDGPSATYDVAAPSPNWPMDPSLRTGSVTPNGFATPEIGDDDVGRFESAKARKTTLAEGIKKFNFKPKRGVEFLVQNGFIKSKTPTDVARFLLQSEGLSKAMIGEYLGEG